MADSIHDQWPVATAEWAAMAGQFRAAWLFAFNAYDVNSDYAAFAACIDYLARLLMDSTVMSGDMLTHLAQTGQDATRGTIQNFRNLQAHVLPQWGAAAAVYVTAAVALEAVQRGLGDAHSREQASADLGFAVGALGVQIQAAVAAEAAARGAGDAHSREQAAAGIKALSDQLTARLQQVLTYAQSIPGLVDQRAAAGYDPSLRSRATGLQRLLDTVVAHDPTVSGLVSKLTGLIVDLAELDDPVLRIAAQLVLKQVIDHLGLDSALHAMLGDLVGALLGGGPPKTLQDIMADIGTRLDALESSVAALAPLDDEADDLHEIGGVIFNAALLGYCAAAIADPKATADATVIALEPVTGPLLAPVRALLGMP